MKYQEARSLIETGDAVAVKRKTGLLASLTRLLTRSDYTHNGIAIWLDGGLWMAELNGGGNHMIPMSQLENMDFDVFYPPVDDRIAIKQAILSVLREHQDYGFAALPVIGLLEWLRVKAFLHARRVLVCSGYVVKVYEEAGWGEHTRILSPRELTGLLVMKLQVMG